MPKCNKLQNAQKFCARQMKRVFSYVQFSLFSTEHQTVMFIHNWIYIHWFIYSYPKTTKKKRWEASAVMETAVRASAENWNCCQASMCLSNPGIRKPKKEAVIVKSNGGENLSYLILVFYASFGPLKTS